MRQAVDVRGEVRLRGGARRGGGVALPDGGCDDSLKALRQRVDAALGHGGDRVSARGLCKRKPGTTEGHEIFWEDDWMEGH